MDDYQDRLTFEEHVSTGKKLKQHSHSIEQIRATLANSYPKSAKKEMRQLQAAFDNIKNVQTSLHSRLLAEFPDKSDDELLPVYLGRYQPKYM
jgi:hypothetical protein